MNKWYIDKGPDSDVIVSSRVRLARNFREYPFPHKSSPQIQKQVVDETFKALSGNDSIHQSFQTLDFTKMDPIDKLVLVEKHVVSKELIEGGRQSGVLLSLDEQISIMINEEDHLRIQCLTPGLQLNKAWEICNRLDDILSESIDFAWDETLGYLTSCPTNLGTAIRVSVMMHLPAFTMTGYIKSILEACGKLGVAVRGLYGENTEATGNMFQLSNQVTLGKSEQDILMNIKHITYQIIEQERALRDELIKQNRNRLEDKIFRSYGILKNARLLDTEETLKRLSDIRLGVDLGIIKDLDETDINEMMLLIQPGGLQKKTGKLLKPEEREVFRADIIRDKMDSNKA